MMSQIDAKNIPAKVDLGLPSGVLWADYNLGASACGNPGSLYAWGELSSKASFRKDNYKCKSRLPGKVEKIKEIIISQIKAQKNINKDGVLQKMADRLVSKYDVVNCIEPECDIATLTLGMGWRLPSRKEMDELETYCKWTFIRKGESQPSSGYIVEGPNGNRIFLPMNDEKEGFYWSSSICVFNTEASHAMRLSRANPNVLILGYLRHYGGFCRPVMSAPEEKECIAP